MSPEPVQHGSLSYEIDLPPEVPAGEPVPIILRARNTGDKRVELSLRGREIAYDIIVTGEDGEVVWRRMEGKMVPAILQIRTLAPSEALELKGVWDQRTNAGSLAGPGHYRVQGTLPTVSRLPARTTAAALRIVAR